MVITVAKTTSVAVFRVVTVLLFTTPIGAAVHAGHVAAQSPSPAESRIPVRYSAVHASSKMTFQQDSTQTEEKYHLETRETGVAWLDYDQDGPMDLFSVQSAATDIYKPAHPLRCALYHK